MKTKIVMFAFFTLYAMNSLAQRHVTYEYGTVIESVPIVEYVQVSVPREQCWEQDIVLDQTGPNNGTVIGAILGGAIGHAVGHKKSNKHVGTVVGAVLGGTVGHAIGAENRHRSIYRGSEEVCRVYEEYQEEERIVGYQVRYRYNSGTYTTRTETDPGDTIKLRLAISPVSS